MVNSKENYLTSQLIRLTHFMNIILLDPVSALNSDVSFLILFSFLKVYVWKGSQRSGKYSVVFQHIFLASKEAHVC